MTHVQETPWLNSHLGNAFWAQTEQRLPHPIPGDRRIWLVIQAKAVIAGLRVHWLFEGATEIRAWSKVRRGHPNHWQVILVPFLSVEEWLPALSILLTRVDFLQEMLAPEERSKTDFIFLLLPGSTFWKQQSGSRCYEVVALCSKVLAQAHPCVLLNE